MESYTGDAECVLRLIVSTRRIWRVWWREAFSIWEALQSWLEYESDRAYYRVAYDAFDAGDWQFEWGTFRGW